MKPLQMWGGVECTLNRVGDLYINQCEKNGHKRRLSDLTLFKSLGIKKLRYPCLWEEVAPKDLDHCNWSWLDERLTELQKLNLDIVAGFLHHGSGPFYTSLIDPDFPEKLATYARLFVTRYPWINDFTPINEINTTARFSTLYGHWYPHLKDSSMFLKAMVLQCRGTILAMKEIRRVNPKARLIQTDDLGKCQSTEDLSYQCEHENERRWLSWDLLCGKVTQEHKLYSWIRGQGISEEELAWFEENPCPPDVIGINHYHLSNRYLDHRLELYPDWSHGGNDIQKYADVGAIDTGIVDNISPEELLRETWERYGITLSVTECHIRGRRESQMRWLDQVWKICRELREENIPIESVTAWSLLGTYDWHNLCTHSENFYEAGVFDLRNPQQLPQETALSRMVRSLATEGSFESPVLASEGVWRTPRRILFNAQPGQFSSLEHRSGTRPILITGASGTLGQAFARICGARNIHYKLLRRQEMDISDLDSIRKAVDLYNPWAIINAAGYVRVDDAESDYDECYRANVEGAVNLAKACVGREIKLINFSSDLVFDGSSGSAYSESHVVSPLNNYGKSKAEAEEMVLSIYPDSLIIRTSSFFGPWDEHNFITKTLQSLARKGEVVAPNDMYVSPTYVPDLANESLDLLIDGERGIIHVTNVGEVSWEEFALQAAAISQNEYDLSSKLIRGVTTEEMRLPARRPRRSSLVSERQRRLPPLEDALMRYFKEVEIPFSENRSL